MIKRVLARLTSALRRMTIRYRLMIALVLLSLLPLLVTGYISFVESSQAIERKAQIYATEIVKQVAKNAQMRMAQIGANAETLILSDKVQGALARYANPSAIDSARAQAIMPGILLNAFGSFDYVSQMYFLSSQSHILDSQVFSQLGQKIGDFAKRAQYDNNQTHWGVVSLRGGEQGIAMTRQIFFKSNNQLAGYLYLGIKPSHFSEIFETMQLDSTSDIYVVDVLSGSIFVQTKARLARSDPDAANSKLNPAVLHALKQGQATGSITYEDGKPTPLLSARSRRVVAVFSAIPETNWFVVHAIPYDSLVAEARAVRNTIGLVGLLGIVAAVLLSYLLWRSISEPLKQLMGLIQDAEAGRAATQMTHLGQDELTLLSRNFADLSIKVRREHELLEERVLARTHELEQANLKLAELSTTDALTGIANRRRFDEMLTHEWRRAARLRQPLALAMIDIDWFKKFNDHYGHQAGDECLRRVASVLGMCVLRPGDLVARYGGEEFVFLVPSTDGGSALRIARNFCEALQALSLPHALSSFTCVTASVGVAAIIVQESSSPDSLVLAADRALYQAKALGRNQAVLSVAI